MLGAVGAHPPVMEAEEINGLASLLRVHDQRAPLLLAFALALQRARRPRRIVPIADARSAGRGKPMARRLLGAVLSVDVHRDQLDCEKACEIAVVANRLPPRARHLLIPTPAEVCPARVLSAIAVHGQTDA